MRHPYLLQSRILILIRMPQSLDWLCNNKKLYRKVTNLTYPGSCLRFCYPGGNVNICEILGFAWLYAILFIKITNQNILSSGLLICSLWQLLLPLLVAKPILSLPA